MGAEIGFADDAKQLATCAHRDQVTDPVLGQQCAGGTDIKRSRRSDDGGAHQFAHRRFRRDALIDIAHHIALGDDAVEPLTLANHQTGNMVIGHAPGRVNQRRLRRYPPHLGAHQIDNAELSDRFHSSL